MTATAPSTLLLGIAVESTVWGGYANLLLFALVLHHRRSATERHLGPVLLMSVMLFLVCTMHLICGLKAIWTATDVGVQVITGGPGDAVVPLCNTLGLLILIGRCWMLWGKQNWVVFPAGAATLLGFVLTTHFTFSPSDPDEVVSTVMALLGHTLLLYSNLSTTPLIAASLDRLSHRLGPLDTRERTSPQLSVPTVVVDCGLLHLIVQIVDFLFVLTDHPLKFAVSASAIQIYGLSSALAVLRTEFGDLPSDIDVEMVMLEPEDEKELDQAIINAFF